jgi:hypothetical protein
VTGLAQPETHYLGGASRRSTLRVECQTAIEETSSVCSIDPEAEIGWMKDEVNDVMPEAGTCSGNAVRPITNGINWQ